MMLHFTGPQYPKGSGGTEEAPPLQDILHADSSPLSCRPPQRPEECSPLPTCDDGLLPCPKPILQTPKLGTAVAARAGANHINFTGMFLSSQHWHHSPH